MLIRQLAGVFGIIANIQGRFDNSVEYPNVYDEYVDIDESSLVKVEFSKTLSGMMSAMEEIQSRADNLVQGIVIKEQELAELEMEANKAERRRKDLEAQSNHMLDEKRFLEDKILFLMHEKEAKEKHITEQETEMER